MQPARSRTLGDLACRELRRGMLDRDHVAPLTDFVRQMRRETPDEAGIPDFDPLDGGTEALCLYLLEAPGARAVSSGFVSRDNPDDTAKNLLGMNEDAGIDRRLTVIWNIVPWYVGSGTKIRPAEKTDIAEGLPYLRRLLELLPSLRFVVLMGDKAAKAEETVRSVRPELRVLRCPHPSPLFVNNKPGNPKRIGDLLWLIGQTLRASNAGPDGI